MTVPTLVLPDRVLDQSRDILSFAMTSDGSTLDPETASWVDLHYSFPIEDLTSAAFLPATRLPAPSSRPKWPLRIAGCCAWPPLIPTSPMRMRARAAVFAERERVFDPATAKQLEATRAN